MINYITRNLISVIFLLLSGFTFVLFYRNLLGKELVFTAIGVLVALYIGLQKQKIYDDNLFRSLFKEFNHRYDSRFNDLINSLRIDKEKKLSTEEINIIIDYLNLSAEEFLWFKKGRIPNDVWKAWKSGIIQNLQIDQVREVFMNEIKSKNSEISYYGLIKEVVNRDWADDISDSERKSIEEGIRQANAGQLNSHSRAQEIYGNFKT